jgi:hypothetical protein
MKGNELILSISKKIAVALTAFLTFFTVASWSQNAFKEYHDLLNAALISIALTLLFTGLFHPRAKEPIYKWWLFGIIRFRHLCIYSAMWFFGILIFPLDSPLFPEICHLIATAMAIKGVFMMVAGWYKTWSWKWWTYMIAISISILMLVSAFILKDAVEWQVGHGEFAILLTALGFLGTIKNK